MNTNDDQYSFEEAMGMLDELMGTNPKQRVALMQVDGKTSPRLWLW